jgi:hypothetical protein
LLSSNNSERLKFELNGQIVGENEYRKWLSSFMPDQPDSINYMMNKLKKVVQDEKSDMSADG